MSSSTGSSTAEPGRPGISKQPPPASANSSALHKAKVNLSYLALGSKAGAAPASIATRSALSTTRYVIRYIVRRLLRYAKYAAYGALITTIGGGLLGTLGSGLAFFAAPSIGLGMGIGVITALTKFGWRHRGNWFRGGIFADMQARAQAGRDGAADEEIDAQGAEERLKRESHRVREDVWMRA
ncbi:hypothetical protein BCR39DRAFT_511688 [Naematelia encephala]|uniref:Uncharacterized protein n=1 Tax=Naematelia encephala TaxID=71784 RepID=A0A1Y2BLW9_9TREE|nr:hypothetical protein BCR39DRAFT_511688 [Naematelia encephala]